MSKDGNLDARQLIEQDERRLDAEYFLKQLALDPNLPIETLANEIDPPIPVKTAEAIVEECAKLLVGTVDEADFPDRIRNYYNNKADPEDALSPNDMLVLLDVIGNKYHKKLMTKQHARQLGAKMKRMGLPTVQEIQVQTTTQSPPQTVIMTDSNPQAQPQQPPSQYPPYTPQQPQVQPQPQPQPQQVQYQVPQQQQQVYSVPYEDEDSLMKYLLEINHAVVPSQAYKIPQFMMLFKSMKGAWTRDPSKLLALLKSSFGNIPGESIWMQFSDMKNQVSNDPANLYRLTGASTYVPVNPVEQMLINRNPALGAAREAMYSTGTPVEDDPSERKLDKWIERMVKMNYVKMMQRMGDEQAQNGMGGMGGQNNPFGMGINVGDYDYFEDLDKDGHIVGRRFVRKLGAGAPSYGYNPYDPNQNGRGDKSMEMVVKVMETMQNQTVQQNNILLQKIISGNDNGGMNDIVGTMVKQVMGAYQAQTDPAVSFTKYLDLGEKIAQMKGASERPKTIEEKKMELDFLLAKQELDKNESKEQREYTRQQEESKNANENVNTVIHEIGGAVKEVAGPLLTTFAAAYGRGIAGGGGPPQGAVDPRQQAQMRQQQQQQQQHGVQQPPQQVIIQTPSTVGTPNTGSGMPPDMNMNNPMYQMQMEEAQRRQAEEWQRQRMEEEEARLASLPVEEQLRQYDDSQIEEMAHRGETQMIQNEKMLASIMAERARRKGIGVVTAPRRYVSPVVNEIAQHEAQMQQQYSQYPQQPMENETDVFTHEPEEEEHIAQEPVEPKVNMSEPKPFALDTSIPVNEQVAMSRQEREALEVSGQLQTEESTLGTPSTANITPEPRDEEEEEDVIAPAPESRIQQQAREQKDIPEVYDDGEVVDVE